MIKINLFPWREQSQHRIKRLFIIIGSMMLITSFLIVFIISKVIALRINKQENLNNQLHKQMESLENTKSKQQTVLLSTQPFPMQRKLYSENKDKLQALMQVIRLIPPGIYLESIKEFNNELVIIGNSESNLDVSDLMLRFHLSSKLKEVKLQNMILNKTDQNFPIKFEVICTLIKGKINHAI